MDRPLIASQFVGNIIQLSTNTYWAIHENLLFIKAGEIIRNFQIMQITPQVTQFMDHSVDNWWAITK